MDSDRQRKPTYVDLGICSREKLQILSSPLGKQIFSQSFRFQSSHGQIIPSTMKPPETQRYESQHEPQWLAFEHSFDAIPAV